MKINYQKGMTLLEVIIVVALLTLVISIVAPRFSTQRDLQVFKSAVQGTVSALDEARTDTLASLNGSTYGVHFQSNQVIVFQGKTGSTGSNVYTPGTSTIIDTINISSPVSISSVSLNSCVTFPCDIYFSRLSGTLKLSTDDTNLSSGSFITFSNSTFYQNVTFSATGLGDAGSLSIQPGMLGTAAPPVVGTVTPHDSGGWVDYDSFYDSVASGTNLLLVDVLDEGCAISSVTYAGITLNRIYHFTLSSGNECHQYWALVSSTIPTGNNPIVVTSSNWNIFSETAINISNAAQTNTFGTSVGFSSSSGGYTSSLSAPTTSSTDLVIDSLSFWDNSSLTSNTTASGQVKRWSIVGTSVNHDFSGSSRLGTNGSTTMGWAFFSGSNPSYNYPTQSAIIIHGK